MYTHTHTHCTHTHTAHTHTHSQICSLTHTHTHMHRHTHTHAYTHAYTQRKSGEKKTLHSVTLCAISVSLWEQVRQVRSRSKQTSNTVLQTDEIPYSPCLQLSHSSAQVKESGLTPTTWLKYKTVTAKNNTKASKDLLFSCILYTTETVPRVKFSLTSKLQAFFLFYLICTMQFLTGNFYSFF